METPIQADFMGIMSELTFWSKRCFKVCKNLPYKHLEICLLPSMDPNFKIRFTHLKFYISGFLFLFFELLLQRKVEDLNIFKDSVNHFIDNKYTIIDTKCELDCH